ncbi:MAG: GLPGLI family protein [bacterium]
MKFIYLLSMLFVMSNVNGQSSSTVYTYEGKFNSRFERSDNFGNYKGCLIVDGDRSLFTMKKMGAKAPTNNEHRIDLSPDSIFTVYKDVESNSLLFEFSDIRQRTHLFADTLFPMLWTTYKDEKTIGGIPCLKAVTQFKGRGYTAWYAPSITISDGPWKLGGLPGLILEAYDDADQWHMTLTSITKGNGFDQQYFETAIYKGVEGFPGFVSYVKKMFERLALSLGAQSTANCVDCQTTPTINFYSWEKIEQ